MNETCEEVINYRYNNNRNDRNNDRNDRNDNKNFGKKGNKYRDEPQQPKISNENMSFQRSTKIDIRPQEPRENLTNMNLTEGDNLGKWGRKDLAKEEKAADEYKQKRINEIEKDPIKFKLTE